MAVIATAEVRVIADTSRFLSNLRRQLRGAFGQVGAQSAEQFTREFRRGLGDELTTTLRQATSRVTRDMSGSGRSAAQSFSTGFSDVANRISTNALDALRTQAVLSGAALHGGQTADSFIAGMRARLDQRLSNQMREAMRNPANRIPRMFRGTGRDSATAFSEGISEVRTPSAFVDDFLSGIDRRQAQLNLRMRQSGIDAFSSFRDGVAQAQQRLSTGVNPIRMQQDGDAAAVGLLTGFRRRLNTSIARVSLRFGRNLNASLVATASRTGSRFGAAFEASLTNRASRIGNSFLGLIRRALGREVEQVGTDSGDRLGRSFGRGLTRSISALTGGFRSLGQALSAISVRPLQALAGAVRNMTSEMVDQIGIFIAVIGLLESLSGLLFALPAALSVAGLGIATIVVGFRGFGSAISAAFDDLSAFEDAIEDLAPAAQAVAREFRAIAPALTELRIDVQEALFRQLEGTITDVAANLMGPLREGMTAAGAALGTLVAEIGEFFAATATADTTTAVFETIALLFEAMAESAQPFLEGMRNLTDEFLPRLTGLAEPLSQIGEQFRDWTEAMIESGQAAAMFDHAVDTFQSLIGVVTALGGVFRAIFDAAALAGVDALGAIVAGIEQVADAFSSFEGQNALVDIFQSLSTIIPIVAEFMGALLVEFGALTPIFAQIAEAIGPALLTVIDALGSALQAMGPGVVAVFEGIAAAAEAVAPALQPLGEAIGTLLSAIAPILPVIGELVAIVIELGAEIIGVLASAIMPIAEAIASALLPILPQLSELFSRLVEAVAPLIQVLGEGLASVIETLLPPVLELGLALADALMPIIEALVPVIAPLLEIVFQLAEVIGALLVPVISLLLPIIEAISPLFELLGLILAPLLELFVAILEPITTLITMLATLLAPIIEFLAEIIGTIVSVALVPLTNAFEFLADVIADYVIPYFEASLVVLQQFWENAIEPLIDWIRDLASTVSDKFGTIRDTVSTLSESWHSAVSGMIEWIQNLWNNVVEAFDGVEGSIDIFKRGWESFWDSVESIASSAWDFIKGIVDSIGSAISSVTDAVSNFDLGSLNPFADGGIVTYPTAALIGEAGTEVVIPLTRPQRAAELAQQSGLINLLTARGAFPEGGGPSGPPLEMHVHSGVADAEQVARRAIRIIERRMGPRGLERV